MVSAGPGGELGFPRAADRRDHPGAGVLGELDGEMADRARAAGYQDRLPVQRAVGEQAAVRRHGRHAQAGAQLGRDAVRHPDSLSFRHDRPFRGRSPAPAGRGEPEPYALAGPAWVNALAHLVDHAGAVVMRDLKSVDRPGRRPGPGLPVGRIHAGELQPYPDLTRARLRPLDLLDPEHVASWSVAVVHRGSHIVASAGVGVSCRTRSFHRRGRSLPWPGESCLNCRGQESGASAAPSGMTNTLFQPVLLA